MEFLRTSIDPEWKDLVEEFPEIFLEPSPEVLGDFKRRNHPVVIDQICNLRYGFECDIGWKEIIRDFCVKTRDLVNAAKSNGHEIHFKTFILKEKLGGLRNQGFFYGPDYRLYYEQFRKIDSELEAKSYTVCERTGLPGRLVSIPGRWLKVLNPELAKAAKANAK